MGFYLTIVTVYKYIRVLIKLMPDLLDTVGACGCYCTSDMLRNFGTQSKTAEEPSRLICQHGNEINTEQFTTGADRVLRWY